MIKQRPGLASAVAADHGLREAYQILMVLEPNCDIEVAQRLANREQQVVKVFHKVASPHPPIYEVSDVFPAVEIELDRR